MIPFLFLFACSQQETYEQGFPKKESPGLSDFLASYFTQQTSLISLDDTYVFSEGNESNTDEEIEFYTIHADELKEFYAPLKEEDQTSDHLKKLFERTEDIQHIEEDDSSLPRVRCSHANTISMEYKGRERQIELQELEPSIHEEDDITCQFLKINDEGFNMQIDHQETNEAFYLFATSDLTQVDIFSSDELEDAVEREELVPFYDMLKVDPSDTYGNILYNTFVDTENHALIYIDEKHISDEKYIYIDGGKDPLEKGVQHIQLVEDYLDGSDEMLAEFDLSYKRIGKQVEFKATNDVSTGKVVYFSEDWIVLFIEYNAPVTGASGSTNVLIDLQDKENPTFYVVDLDII